MGLSLFKIGLVYDNLELLDLTGKLLLKNGFDVVYTAKNDREAINKNNAKPVHVIVIIGEKFYKGGVEAAKQILLKYPRTKFIFCVGDCFDIDYTLDKPSVSYLPFPFQSQQLIKEINLLIKNDDELTDYKKKYERLVRTLRLHFGDSTTDKIIEHADNMM